MNFKNNEIRIFYSLFYYLDYIIIMWVFSKSESDIILQEYSKNPVKNFEMEDFTVKYHEWNFICGDDITVFLLIDGDIVKDYSYTWNTSTVSLASAWFISEFVIWEKVKNLLNRDYDFLIKNWLDVSKKRKRAASLPILAIKNAIHEYLDDGKIEDFDDIIDN